VTAVGPARDRGLEAAVRDRLDRGEGTQVRVLARYEVGVQDGRATLTGRVRSRQAARAMAALAGRVRGVSAVEDRLVADDEIVLLVASAIGRTARNRASRLVVRAELGHVRIGGVFPSTEAHADALRVGAAVPGVLAVSGARPSDFLS
jgi:osmotically-inducible protein OsmY